MGKLSKLLCWFVLIAALLLLCKADGKGIGIYELKRGGFSLKVTNYGATVLSLILPDKNGITKFFLLLHTN